MKKCPACGRIYSDETQNFCLDDGAWLVPQEQIPEHPTAVFSKRDLYPAEPETKMFSSNPDAMTVSMAGYQLNSIAVLPFAHLSNDPDDEYFCEGLAEELINALSRVDDLKVVGRTSAFSFKGKNVGIAQIGSILNVDKVVEGSVRKFGDRMRINVSLTSTADGFNIWSDKYDTEMRDIFDVQDEITASVVGALKIKLLGKDETPDNKMTALIAELKHHAQNVEAYQHYLRGRFHLNKFNHEDFDLAIASFEQAIKIDPNYAAAWAGLADAHALSTELGSVPPQVGMPKARDAALRAISLDPQSSEAHMSLGFVQQDFEFRFAEAEQSYLRAIELNPNNAAAHAFYGGLLSQLGRHNEAEKRIRKAIVIDPLSAMGHFISALQLFLARRPDDSIAESKEILEIEPNYPAAYLTLSFAHQMKGNFAESVEAYATFGEMCGMSEIAAMCRNAFETDGWHGFLRTIIDPKTAPTVTAYIIAVYQAALGENEAAMTSLERSLAEREPHIVMVKVDPRFDELRADPRFHDLVRKVGFPD